MRDATDFRAAVAALVARVGQSTVAEAIGVSQPTISRFIAGHTRQVMPIAFDLQEVYPELREPFLRMTAKPTTADAAGA